MSEFLQAFERLLAAHYSPHQLRAMEENSALGDAALLEVEKSGFLDIFKEAESGGAGQSLLAGEALIRAVGSAAAPASLAIAMVERGNGGRTSMPLLAVTHALLIAGALEKLLSICVAHVTTRRQFGKPLAAQQALQQQMAELAEQAALVRIAAQYSCASGFALSEERAAIAKYTASAAVPHCTAIAHAVHGAIGMTDEYDLQLWVRRLHDWRITAGAESYWADKTGKMRIKQATLNSVDFAKGI